MDIGFALHGGKSECHLLLLCIRVDILWTSIRVAAKAAKLNMKKSLPLNQPRGIFLQPIMWQLKIPFMCKFNQILKYYLTKFKN